MEPLLLLTSMQVSGPIMCMHCIRSIVLLTVLIDFIDHGLTTLCLLAGVVFVSILKWIGSSGGRNLDLSRFFFCKVMGLCAPFYLVCLFKAQNNYGSETWASLVIHKIGYLTASSILDSKKNYAILPVWYFLVSVFFCYLLFIIPLKLHLCP